MTGERGKLPGRPLSHVGIGTRRCPHCRVRVAVTPSGRCTRCGTPIRGAAHPIFRRDPPTKMGPCPACGRFVLPLPSRACPSCGAPIPPFCPPPLPREPEPCPECGAPLLDPLTRSGCLVPFQIAATWFSTLFAAGCMISRSPTRPGDALGLAFLLGFFLFFGVIALAVTPLLLGRAGIAVAGDCRVCSRCDWLGARGTGLDVRQPRWRGTLDFYRRTSTLVRLATLFLLAVTVYECDMNAVPTWSAALFWLVLSALPPLAFCRSRLAAALEPPEDKK